MVCKDGDPGGKGREDECVFVCYPLYVLAKLYITLRIFNTHIHTHIELLPPTHIISPLQHEVNISQELRLLSRNAGKLINTWHRKEMKFWPTVQKQLTFPQRTLLLRAETLTGCLVMQESL